MTVGAPRVVPPIVTAFVEHLSWKPHTCNPKVYWKEDKGKVSIWVIISHPASSTGTRLDEDMKLLAVNETEALGKGVPQAELHIAERDNLLSEDSFIKYLGTEGYLNG